MVSVQARLEQVSYATQRGLSQRMACTLLKISRSNLFYSPKMPVKDAPVIEAMKTLSGTYPRFGSRRIRIFLQRDGIMLGKERCIRLWARAGLQVPKKRKRKRAGTTLRPLAPTARNSVWSYDFVHNACANGQKIKCLTVVDEYTRECLAIDMAGSIRSSRVIDVLSKLMRVHGMPKYLRSDNGPEFVSKALLEWAIKESLQISLIDPGKPWQNGTNEIFNGKFRDECLSMEWFRNRLEAKVIIEDWRTYYNDVRPHSSLDYKTPNEFKLTQGSNLTTGLISLCEFGTKKPGRS
jgi:putative transposase